MSPGLYQVRVPTYRVLMITAVHTLIYGEDPEAARAFFRDVLQLPGTDTEPDAPGN